MTDLEFRHYIPRPGHPDFDAGLAEARGPAARIGFAFGWKSGRG